MSLAVGSTVHLLQAVASSHDREAKLSWETIFVLRPLAYHAISPQRAHAKGKMTFRRDKECSLSL